MSNHFLPKVSALTIMSSKLLRRPTGQLYLTIYRIQLLNSVFFLRQLIHSSFLL